MGNKNGADYEKPEYLSFFIGLILFFLSVILPAACLKKSTSPDVAIKIIFIICSLYMILLSFIIYKKERVYWITTYSYEDACEMDQKERKRICFRMFKTFGIVFGILIIYLLVGFLLKISFIADIIIFVVAVIIACIFA